MQLKAFTLIELLIVVFIIGIVSFLVISIPSFNNKKYSILDLKQLTYPNGTFYLFEDGSNLLVKDKNKSINISINLPEVLEYKDGYFVKKEFKKFKGKKVIFKYSQKSGLGDFFILKCDEGVFVFKPLYIKKFSNLQKAEDFYILKNYQKADF